MSGLVESLCSMDRNHVSFLTLPESITVQSYLEMRYRTTINLNHKGGRGVESFKTIISYSRADVIMTAAIIKDYGVDTTDVYSLLNAIYCLLFHMVLRVMASKRRESVSFS